MEACRRSSTRENSRFVVQQLAVLDPAGDLARDVRDGLSRPQKILPPKYFYDELGSRLYDKICQVPEYYPARTEAALLEEKAGEIIEEVRPDTILELGSGTSHKTTHLLNACEANACHASYLPLDVCEEMLIDAGNRLLDQYEWLKINALVGDYSAGFDNLPGSVGSRLYVFLGGTLGNLNEFDARDFLASLRGMMGQNDYLLLGVDRVKDPRVLHAAYNDSQGYTAAFNRNILNVINRELDGHFDPEQFEHRAFFNEDKSQIEMHLHSVSSQTVRIDGLDMNVRFEPGESIHTEISRKFTPEALASLTAAAGLSLVDHFEPENGYFSLVLLSPASVKMRKIK
ncbi:MAG: L-histidine N(alpha)-methyltransferase [Acidiferrobacterales bacterium]|nr:L-histidine N(alpha)-methyltransferase [Acidiferrobacterales bacterium]